MNQTTDTATCEHLHTHDEMKSRFIARWVSPFDENYDESDPQETVEIKDGMVICDDCGEVVDVYIGD